MIDILHGQSINYISPSTDACPRYLHACSSGRRRKENAPSVDDAAGNTEIIIVDDFSTHISLSPSLLVHIYRQTDIQIHAYVYIFLALLFTYV